MKHSRDLTQHFCEKPFSEFVLFDGPEYQSNCCCWLMKPIGYMKGEMKTMEVWNSPEIQEFRRSIHEGTFEHCWEHCPHIAHGDLPLKNQVRDPYYRKIIDEKMTVLPKGPLVIQLNNDKSCNLKCPTCREERVMVVNGSQYDEMRDVMNRLLDGRLQDVEKINITGAGDPFASKLYREFLLNLDGEKYPQLRIDLFTNGVLFTPEMWMKLHRIHKNIGSVLVSLDAATEETYNKVRVGGDFQKAIENCFFLSELMKNKEIEYFELDYVVQGLNYKEMADFVRLGERIGNNTVFFQRIWNWGTFTDDEFQFHEIQNPKHPEHQNFRSLLRDPIFKSSFVNMSNLTEFLPIDMPRVEI